MAAITKEDVIGYAPELSSVSADAWLLILPYVNTLSASQIEGGEEGATLKKLRVLLAAHYATISRRGRTGAAGPVTSEAVGAVRRSFGLVALASSDASLGATGYGQQFLGVLQMSLSYGPFLL